MSAWWQEALRYPARHRGALAWIVVLSLVSIGLNLLLPWPIKLIVDGVLAGKPYTGFSVRGSWARDAAAQLLWLALASAGLFVLLRATEMARASLAARIGRRMQYELGGALFLAPPASIAPLSRPRSDRRLWCAVSSPTANAWTSSSSASVSRRSPRS